VNDERLGRTRGREGVLFYIGVLGYETEKVTVGKFGKRRGLIGAVRIRSCGVASGMSVLNITVNKWIAN
jgi:hypothetical protein